VSCCDVIAALFTVLLLYSFALQWVKKMVATLPSLKVNKVKSSPSRSYKAPGARKTTNPNLSLVHKGSARFDSGLTTALPAIPVKIQCLLLLQKSVTVLSATLVLATLGVYAWSVYLPKLWSKEFRRLETLQSSERQLVALDETLKNQLAEQAEDPKMGLVPPHPSQPLFLAPAALKTAVKPNTVKKLPLPITQGRSPLAY
jgi:hypothetical protein